MLKLLSANCGSCLYNAHVCFAINHSEGRYKQYLQARAFVILVEMLVESHVQIASKEKRINHNVCLRHIGMQSQQDLFMQTPKLRIVSILQTITIKHRKAGR